MTTTTTTTTLIAYHGDPDLKDRFLAELKAHADADAIVQGTYGETVDGQWRGCAVGCSIHSMAKITGHDLDPADHALYESVVGIPEWLAHLEEAIFETLPVGAADLWPVRFAQAIPVGADLEPVRHQFLEWVMERNLEKARGLPLDEVPRSQVIGVITAVRDLHAARVPADDPRWTEVREAAWAAADAAWEPTAATALGWGVLRAAAWVTEQSSARAVARASWTSAGRKESRLVADQLIILLSEAGPGEGLK